MDSWVIHVVHLLLLLLPVDVLFLTIEGWWVTYKSKKKHAPLKWAALRIGFSGADWGAPFLLALSEANFPKADFLVERPTRDLCGFTRSPADWSDATRVLQALLVMSGINATEAAGFTFHSCRHTYPTCAS